VNCKEFQELISPAVDDLLAAEDLAAFRGHSKVCTTCRFEFEAEAATKVVVRMHARRVPAPAVTLQQISRLIAQEQPMAPSGWFGRVTGSPFFRPAIGFAMGFVVILLLLRPNTTTSPVLEAGFASNDVIGQSLVNYSAVLDGSIQPQIASSEPHELAPLFTGITDYSVHMPRMKDCRLVGGMQNDFAGVKLAHVVYRHDNEMVYIYQACWSTVEKGEKLRLSNEARDSLLHTGWFTATQPDGRTVVLWKKGRTLCVAVSRMSKGALVECLLSGEETERPW
jgi:anti-sigma factor RsiW